MLIVAIMERIVLPMSTGVIVSCREDKHDLQRVLDIDGLKISLVEDGVDEEEFHPSIEEGRKTKAELGLSNKCVMIAFVGNLQTVHNFEAATNIVERVSALVPEDFVRFIIVGPHGILPEHWYDNERVRFTGYVPRVGPYVNAADICIAPLTSGSGMKTKVLAYLACCKPIITTPQGAQGLDLRHGHDAIICELPEFPSWIQRLATTSSLRENLSRNLAQTSRNLSWEMRARTYRDVLRKVAQ
jgi:glycosyltransferase involved in cell wall biosynthesis